MVALIIIGVLFLLFFLIGQIRVGMDFSISDDQIVLIATVTGFRLQLIPRTKKAEAGSQKKQHEEQQPAREPPKRSQRIKKKKKLFFKIDLYDICEMLSRVSKGLIIFKHGFQLKRLLIHFTAASWNPYTTAQISAYADAFLSVFAALIENAKHCKNCDIRTEIDFEKSLPELDFGIWITFRIGAAVETGFYILFGLIVILVKIMFRFLWMKWRDPEEYDFRMNRQENPFAFIRRVIRESREQKEKFGVIHGFDPNSPEKAPEENKKIQETIEAENRAEVFKLAEQYAAQTGAVLSEEPEPNTEFDENTPNECNHNSNKRTNKNLIRKDDQANRKH